MEQQAQLRLLKKQLEEAQEENQRLRAGEEWWPYHMRYATAFFQFCIGGLSLGMWGTSEISLHFLLPF